MKDSKLTSSSSKYNTFPTNGDFEEQLGHQEDGYQYLLPQTQQAHNSESAKSLTTQRIAFIGFAAILTSAVFAVSNHYYRSSNSSVIAQKMKYLSGSKPNFIFVLIDDAGWNSLGYMNYDLAFATPHMTSMAEKGIILSNYYAQEMCVPSRAAFLTGRYPIHTTMHYKVLTATTESGLPLTETTIADALKDNGYTNYMLGKWDQGLFTPQYLPTARGFDYFLGYLDGQNYYWSKRDPEQSDYTDFIYADTSCYNVYDGIDKETYSTNLYASKAVDAIEAHDFDNSPMFMYFASQAVHDPYSDYNDAYATGIPPSYVGTDVHAEVMSNIVGTERQQYTLALKVLDNAVKSIMDAMDAAGQTDNTYYIISADNGGCVSSGGRNGPLRGSKGSLYEGGVKVDAFIYSPLLSNYSSTTYTGLFHTSDWFPTIMSLAGITFKATTGYALDGVDHAATLKSDRTSSTTYPRTYLLYNMYGDSDNDYSPYTNSPAAVRNNQYKLLHAFTDNAASQWYTTDEEFLNDDALESNPACGYTNSFSGTYTKFLFDLKNDPYETTNLYGLSEYADVQAALYAKMAEYYESVVPVGTLGDGEDAALSYWTENGGFLQPYSFSISKSATDSSYPLKCTSESNVFGPTYTAAEVIESDDNSGHEKHHHKFTGSKTAATSTGTGSGTKN